MATMAAVREERRLVTCMFVDVVGSTELTMQFGAERLKRELGAAFAELSRIITEHGGTVEKYIGDAIYALFGAPLAHDDDTLRALRTAEAMREWCVHGQPHGHPFAIRVGIETGEAIVDLEAAASTRQQMSVGAVVNIAARLQQRAEPGEILVGPTAREATAGAADLEQLGAAELKGIGTLPIWKLVRVGGTQIPALPFVGREAEIALLAHAYARANGGRSVLAVVSGPPGQGKTRLVQEFLRERGGGSRVIATRCRPADEVGVFAPLREILGVTTLDALAEQVGRLCTNDVECERVVAGLAESAGIATSRSLARLPTAERVDEIVQAWRRYLGILGQDHLVVLLIDDIHWADSSLVRLVDRLTFGGPRILVLATARPEFAEAAGIRPSGDRFFIELEGLEVGEARQLAALAGRSDERVIARAEGNPLFLVELARATRSDDLPLTLQGALGARLDQLPPTDRTLLSLAAVAGERFTAEDSAFLAQRDVVETGRALVRLADLHFLVVSDMGYRFHHGLVRDVAYGRLLSAERMRAHARFAREHVSPGDIDTLAYHWWEALRPPDAEWVWGSDATLSQMRHAAFAANLAAGKRHAGHAAIDQAVELLERALSFASDDRERADAEQALGVAYRQILRQDESWEHFTRALDLFRAHGAVPVDLYAELMRSAVFTGAFRRLPSVDEVVRIGEDGAAAAKAAGDLRLLSRILESHGAYLLNAHGGQRELGRSFIDAAIEAAESSGDAEARRSALLSKVSLLRGDGRIDESVPLLDEVGRSLEGADALERMDYVMERSGDALTRGDLRDAETRNRDLVALAEPMGPHNRTHAWSFVSDMLIARGDWDAVIELAHRTARLIADEKASAFCRAAASVLRDGAVAHALRSEREEAMALLRAIPTNDVQIDVVAGVPRALLGLNSPETDKEFASRRRTWPEWLDAAFRAVILSRPDAAERTVREMGRMTTSSVLGRAFAEAVHEAVAELRGGPPATYEALRQIGFVGWIEILRRRADAEY